MDVVYLWAKCVLGVTRTALTAADRGMVVAAVLLGSEP
jgi:hypothetical protein